MYRRTWPKTDGTKSYQLFAACVTEVEVDVLTGEKTVSAVCLRKGYTQALDPLI